jgi:hypothetical protein
LAYKGVGYQSDEDIELPGYGWTPVKSCVVEVPRYNITWGSFLERAADEYGFSLTPPAPYPPYPAFGEDVAPEAKFPG